MVVRPRSQPDVWAKRIEVTQAGAAALRRALPITVDVQRRLFGDEGRPGGNLLTAFLNFDSEHSEATKLPLLAALQQRQPRAAGLSTAGLTIKSA